MAEYNREDIPVFRRYFRTKERDSYVFGNDEFKVSLTAADYGYIGWITLTVFRLSDDREQSAAKLFFLPHGRLGLSPDHDRGDVVFRSKNVSLDAIRSPGKRILRCRWTAFDDVRPLYINVTLEDSEIDGLWTETPFLDSDGRLRDGLFSFGHKTVGLRVSGLMQYGAEQIEFHPEDTVGAYRFDRGLLPFEARREWCWAVSGDCAFTFGGWGERQAGENLVVIGGESYTPPKTQIRSGQHSDEWRVRTPDDSIDLTFEPIIERRYERRLSYLAAYEIHQDIGRYSGTITVDGGVTRTLDGAMGFAEEIFERM